MLTKGYILNEKKRESEIIDQHGINEKMERERRERELREREASSRSLKRNTAVIEDLSTILKANNMSTWSDSDDSADSPTRIISFLSFLFVLLFTLNAEKRPVSPVPVPEFSESQVSPFFLRNY